MVFGDETVEFGGDVGEAAFLVAGAPELLVADGEGFGFGGEGFEFLLVAFGERLGGLGAEGFFFGVALGGVGGEPGLAEERALAGVEDEVAGVGKFGLNLVCVGVKKLSRLSRVSDGVSAANRRSKSAGATPGRPAKGPPNVTLVFASA